MYCTYKVKYLLFLLVVLSMLKTQSSFLTSLILTANIHTTQRPGPSKELPTPRAAGQASGGCCRYCVYRENTRWKQSKHTSQTQYSSADIPPQAPGLRRAFHREQSEHTLQTLKSHCGRPSVAWRLSKPTLGNPTWRTASLQSFQDPGFKAREPA